MIFLLKEKLEANESNSSFATWIKSKSHKIASNYQRYIIRLLNVHLDAFYRRLRRRRRLRGRFECCIVIQIHEHDRNPREM